MKKLFYRLSRSRSLAKLFSLLACLALGPLFVQQAYAQFDFEFGWEPFPPSSWDGGWDPILNCNALPGGTTKLTRTPSSGPDTVVQDGTVECTFTDSARTPVFQETATCKLHIKINNLGESCGAGPSPGTSTLTVTGICPTATIPEGQGTIDCSGGAAGGNDPTFCLYAGSDPDGNTSESCVWNLGWGAKKGPNVVPMTQNQCQVAFGTTKVVYSFSQILEGTGCAPNAQIVEQGETFNNYCHSDTWDPAQKAFCDFTGGQVKNTAEATVQNFLTVDTEYTPQTINTDCSNNKDQGDITLLVFGTNREKNSSNNPIAVQSINPDTITVNDRPVDASSCGFPNPDTLSCRVASCANNKSIVDGHIIGNTGSLRMDACIGNRDSDPNNPPCTITHVIGDLEFRKVK